MAPPNEMQQMEMEMVEGMYDTYEPISDDPPSYSVLMAPTSEDAPELKVCISYPESYPEEAACVIALENISKHHRLQLGNITKAVAATCEENIGTHSVILALQQVQEFLSTAAQEAEKAELVRRGAALEAASISANGASAEDPTIRMGTAVTKELFETWSKQHQAEKARLRQEREKKITRVSASKLSGKQLWDSTLKAADWELFGEEGGEDVDFDTLQDLDEDEFDFDD